MSARGFGFGAAAGGPALWSWGRNNNGQLGLGNLTNYSSPKQVGTLTDWSDVAGGSTSSATLKTDGTLWNSGNIPPAISSFAQVGVVTTWSKLSQRRTLRLAIQTNGTLWAWGANSYGELGLGNLTSYSSPKQVGALTTWTKVGMGYNFTLAIKT